MGAFLRLYTFLSQIFDYGNTAIEKRVIFYKRLLPLLEFGREREGDRPVEGGADPSQPEGPGQAAPCRSATARRRSCHRSTEAGSGSVQEKQKALLAEIIEKVNDLFEGELTDQDKLVYVNNVIKGKLLEIETLKQQAANNTKEQFANSPDLREALMNAIMDALDAHTDHEHAGAGFGARARWTEGLLLGPAQLYEALRAKSQTDTPRAERGR